MKNLKIYTTNYCSYCTAAKQYFKKMNWSFEEIDLTQNQELREKLSQENGGWKTVPMIFIGDYFVGGFTDFRDQHQAGKLDTFLK